MRDLAAADLATTADQSVDCATAGWIVSLNDTRNLPLTEVESSIRVRRAATGPYIWTLSTARGRASAAALLAPLSFVAPIISRSVAMWLARARGLPGFKGVCGCRLS